MAHASATPQAGTGEYGALEERILDRDQRGAAAIYFDLHRAGTSLANLLAEGVRIHAPYTHVPYHERIDDGYVNFVNNDHCLLSARATSHLTRMVAPELSGLPMAQTIWYIPTGLDIWNQKLNRAPGHYARGFEPPAGAPPAPVIHWPDQPARPVTGSFQSALDEWTNLVHRGEVVEAYRLFQGMINDASNRPKALAQLVFAGLMDLQDRVYLNRSYTTGHKAYRARATVELGSIVGWPNAHDVIYAGALDIAVGPRWYSTYELACNAIKTMVDGEPLRAIPYAGSSDMETMFWRQREAIDDTERAELIDALIREPEPAGHEQISKLMLAGKAPRHVMDAIQIAAATVLLGTRGDLNFSIPQHCYEYCNTVRWFGDEFGHPQRTKFLYTAASFVARNAEHQRNIHDTNALSAKAPAKSDGMPMEHKLIELDAALLALDADASLAWTQACIEDGGERDDLVRTLAGAACKIGNDPHNQEIALCFLEDYGRSTAPDKELLLLGCAHHTASHRKYGDYLECYHRYCDAMDIEATA